MHLSVVITLVFCVIGGCHANTFRLGACPRVLVMKELDFDKFLGEWYVIQRFNPMATCTKIFFEKSPEGTYSMNETARPLGLNFNFHNPLIKARKLEFLRNDTNSIFRAEKDFAHFTLSTFGIVDTDYDTYALVWGCDPVLFGSVQNVDLLARKPDPQLDLIKAAKDILKDMAIDYQPLDNVDQSSCSEASSSTHSSGDDQDKNTNNIVVG